MGQQKKGSYLKVQERYDTEEVITDHKFVLRPREGLRRCNLNHYNNVFKEVVFILCKS